MSIRASAIDPLLQRERFEHRNTLQLLKSWDAARRGRDLPAIGDFDFNILKGIGSSIFLLTIDGPDHTPVFRYVGQDLLHQVGRDLTGQPLSEVPRPSALAQIAYQYLRVTVKRRPVALKGNYSVSASETGAYRGILLPFSDYGEAVTAILGAFQCDGAVHRSDRSDEAPDSGEQSHATIVGVATEQSKAAAGWIAIHAGIAAENSRAAAGWVAAHAAGRGSEFWQQFKTSLALLAAARPRAAWPVGLDDRLKLLPTLGRVALAPPSESEFAFLLARRVDGDPTQYEVAEIQSPLTLLALAFRCCFRSASRRPSSAQSRLNSE